MTERNHNSAVIYCRVSSAKQVRDGHGLDSQETRCRDFASYKSYTILNVFRDEGVSGGMIDRPGMQAMLTFLKSRKRKEQPAVIIDDISRLARGLEAHLQLRTAIGDAGGRLESPSIEFGDDPDSILVENLLASVSQHQRQKNTEQVKNRMKARVQNGYWVFSPVVGYRYEDVAGHGSMLVRDEPNASIVKEAFEGYASGRFETQSEVQRFFESCPTFPHARKGKVHIHHVKRILRRSLYAGYIDVRKWGIILQAAKHEPLVSFNVWQSVQDKLYGKPKAPIRKDTSADFPLRGFVTCASCDKPMSAGWSTGRNAKYPYYFCKTKGCPECRRSIKKEHLEGAFESLLKALRPRPALFYTAKKMLEDLWETRAENAQARATALAKQSAETETKIGQIMDRLIACDSPTLIARYESEVQKLEARKIAISEQTRAIGKPVPSFEGTFRTACAFLANPCKLWDSGLIEYRKMVLRLVFAGRLPYDRNEGFRTAILSLPFKALGEFSASGVRMVEPRGIEPLTFALRTRRSPI